MWRRVGLLEADVSEEHVASIFRIRRNNARRGNVLVSYRLTLFLALVISYPEDGGDTFLRNVGF
jgi:hypothetical protein